MASRTSNISMAKSETVQRCAAMDFFTWNSHANGHPGRTLVFHSHECVERRRGR